MHSVVWWQTQNDAAFLTVVNMEVPLVFRNLCTLQFDYFLEDLFFILSFTFKGLELDVNFYDPDFVLQRSTVRSPKDFNHTF